MPAKGIALNIGLNGVDPKHYGGWSGPLLACEADANDMADLARSRAFAVTPLLTKAATRASMFSEITKAASTLVSGDIFLLTYSGHGGQLPDLNGDEPDGQDETWCLYDGQVVDDEIYALLAKFAKGVRVLMFSDSCHSGTVAKLAFYKSIPMTSALTGATSEIRYRFMPNEIAQRTYRDNRRLYDPILKDAKLKSAPESVKASVLLISGCEDNQLSSDGTFNGLFTGELLQVWNSGKFKGNYRAFYRGICNRMPPVQTPNYFHVGPVSGSFEKQTPFTI